MQYFYIFYLCRHEEITTARRNLGTQGVEVDNDIIRNNDIILKFAQWFILGFIGFIAKLRFLYCDFYKFLGKTNFPWISDFIQNIKRLDNPKYEKIKQP